jgi:sialidase-1
VVVEAGAVSYSTVTRLADGRVGLLYERGTVDAIVFATFDPASLAPCGA